LAAFAGRPVVFGWNTRRLAGDYLAAFRTWLLLTPVVYAVSFAAELVYRLVAGEPPKGHPILQTFQEGPVPHGVFILLLVQAVVVAPIKEEVFFRGIVQPWLASKPWGGDVAMWLAAAIGVAVRSSAAGQVGDLQSAVSTAAPALLVLATLPAYWLIERLPLMRWLPVRDPVARTQIARAIIGTSLLFANFHANVWPTPIPLFVLAVGLGWLSVRTQSVMAPIVVHMLFNAIVFAALVFAPTPAPG
jgi:membrane protease YdiL (CAAX protease family)